eukprot:COSAG04_NODE_875_length_9692_cov_6.365266_7_plen_145_part_00
MVRETDIWPSAMEVPSAAEAPEESRLVRVAVVSAMEMLAVALIIAVCVVGGYAQLHIFRVVADPSDGDGPGEPKDDADLGEMEMREDESRISYKQRMLQRRLDQKQAEAAVLRQGVESYRAYQEHELREVRSAPLAFLRAKPVC